MKAGHRIDWQYECVMRLFGWVKESERLKRPIRRFREGLIFVSKKNKKALALDTPIPTPTGWTTMGELKAGDEVFSEDGHICRVSVAHSVIEDEAYRVEFSNGEQIVCNGEHLWKTTALNHEVGVGKKQKGCAFTGNGWTGSLGLKRSLLDVRSTKNIASTLHRPDGARNHSIDLQLPIDTPDRWLPIDPYVFGVWLGDGDSDTARITCSCDDFPIYRKEFAAAGYSIPHEGTKENHMRFTYVRKDDLCAGRTVLKRIGVFKNKHIPADYLRASIQQRTALLQGMMDTDGCINKDGKNITYCA